MSFLPSLHPALTLHLFDQALTPIISSTTAAPSDNDGTRAAATTSLSRSALAAYSSAQRLEMGQPVRIMVECELPSSSRGTLGGGAPGPVVLSSFVEPGDPSATSTTAGPGGARGRERAPGSGSRSSGTVTGSRPVAAAASSSQRLLSSTTATASETDSRRRRRRIRRGDETDSEGDGSERREREDDDDGDDSRRGRTHRQNSRRAGDGGRTYGNGGHRMRRGGNNNLYGDVEDSGTSLSSTGAGAAAAPTLFGLVVAPDAGEHGGEARRAAARLERLAREFQAAWVEDQRRGLSGAAGDGEAE